MRTYKLKKLRRCRSKYSGMANREICTVLYKENEVFKKLVDKFELKLL